MRLAMLSFVTVVACSESADVADPPAGPTPLPTPATLEDLGDITDFSDLPRPPVLDTQSTEPPTGVTAPCWRWISAVPASSDVPPFVAFSSHDPETLEPLVIATDLDFDGAWDQTYWYDWDESFDNPLRIGSETDGDGIVDSVSVDLYTSTGALHFHGFDSDADGVFDTSTTLTLDGGQPIAGEQDETGDGIADTVVSFFYDDASREVAQLFDRGFDGTIDERVDTTYTDLPDGQIEILREHDYNADGTVGRTFTEVFDSDGLPLSWSTRSNGSGEQLEYLYDEEGTLIEELSQSYDNGQPLGPLLRTVFTYEAPGRVATSHIYEVEAGGDVLWFDYTWTWSCP